MRENIHFLSSRSLFNRSARALEIWPALHFIVLVNVLKMICDARHGEASSSIKSARSLCVGRRGPRGWVWTEWTRCTRSRSVPAMDEKSLMVKFFLFLFHSSQISSLFCSVFRMYVYQCGDDACEAGGGATCRYTYTLKKSRRTIVRYGVEERKSNELWNTTHRAAESV